MTIGICDGTGRPSGISAVPSAAPHGSAETKPEVHAAYVGQFEPADRIYGRVFAAAYLLSLPLLVAGVIGLTVTRGAAWAVVMMIAAAVVLAVLANLLKRVDPDLDTGPRRFGQLSGYQIGWYHLVLGAELRRAFWVLRADLTRPRRDQRAGSSRPKRRW